MALPNKITVANPTGSVSARGGAAEERAVKLFMQDIFGIPDNTNMTALGIDIQANGTVRMLKRLEMKKGGNIASATTINFASLGLDGNFFEITGSTGPIAAFGTVQAGTKILLQFKSTPTITHNASSMILNGGVDYVAEAEDFMGFISLGSGNWSELWRSQRLGWHLLQSTTVIDADNAASVTLSTGVDATYDQYMITLHNVLPETDGEGFILTITQSASEQTGATDYEYAFAEADGGTAGWQAGAASQGDTEIQLTSIATDGPGSGTGEGIDGMIYFSEPDATSTKQFWWELQYTDETATPLEKHIVGSGVHNGDTGAIDGAILKFVTDTILSGTFHLYGLQK